MPRRKTPDPIALAVGQRIRQLRLERGLTAESLAFSGKLSSKGFMSDVERGLAMPSLTSLCAIADLLQVALLDLVTFPTNDERQALVDRTRHLSRGVLRRLLKDLSAAGPHSVVSSPAAPARAKPVLIVRDSQRPKRRKRRKP